MPKETSVKLKGNSGRSYDFDVYLWNTSFNLIGAVYAVLKKNGPNFTILYVGQTNDLSERFDNHHKQGCFDRNNKTHIAIHAESSEPRRFTIEIDLVRHYSPTCND